MEFRRKIVKRLSEILDASIEMDASQRKKWATEMEKGIYDESMRHDDSLGMVKDLDHIVTKKVTRKILGGDKTIKRYPFRGLYYSIYLKVSSNLSPVCKNYEDLIDRLCEQKINPRELASLPHIELDPNNFQADRQKEIDEEADKVPRIFKDGKGKFGVAIKIPYDIVEETIPETGETIRREVIVPDGMLCCGKCGMQKTSSYEMQTRSADEPMTIFATCLCCGHRWRF